MIGGIGGLKNLTNLLKKKQAGNAEPVDSGKEMQRQQSVVGDWGKRNSMPDPSKFNIQNLSGATSEDSTPVHN